MRAPDAGEDIRGASEYGPGVGGVGVEGRVDGAARLDAEVGGEVGAGGVAAGDAVGAIRGRGLGAEAGHREEVGARGEVERGRDGAGHAVERGRDRAPCRRHGAALGHSNRQPALPSGQHVARERRVGGIGLVEEHRHAERSRITHLLPREDHRQTLDLHFHVHIFGWEAVK